MRDSSDSIARLKFVCSWNCEVDRLCLSRIPYPLSELLGRPSPLRLIRVAYTLSFGTITVLPPLVSLYGTPWLSSLSMTAEASEDDRLLYSGA